MGTRLHPIKDVLPVTHKTKKSLKKQMVRWLRRRGKKDLEEPLRTHRHKGWWW